MVVNSMSYATYERYKDSGVDWLGEIPSDWELISLNRVSKVKSISNHPNERLLSVYLEKGVIPFEDVSEKRTNGTSDNLDKYQLVDIGDFVLNNQQAWRGSVGVSNYRGIISPAYIILEISDKLNSKFANYFFRSEKMIYQYVIHSKGVGTIQRNLYWQSFKNSLCWIPSLEEQTKIANFLDQKTAQIDQAIALKQQQIEKLGEYKQIVIQNAVTKGLDPNAPMKDSGVAWIGDIPEHWEMVSIKRIAKISPKVDLSNYKLDEKVTFLPMEKVSSNGDIDCEILKPIRKVKQGFTAFKKNDVILAKITPCFENGKGALLDKLETEIGYGSTEFHVLRASKRIKAYYLYLITHSSNFLTLGEAMMTGSAGQKRVPTDFVANYQFPLPPMSEQQQIIEYVENLNRKISDTIQSYQTQIDRLKEYKNILINQAVTGKIKI